MTWSAALTSAEGAAIYTTIGTLVGILITAAVARVKPWLLAHEWRAHRADQKAILANQKLILGDRFERPAA